MNLEARNLVLSGKYIRLEPLDYRHIDDLVTAAAVDPTLYQWSPVPQGKGAATKYVNTAIAWCDAGTAVPFAIIRLQDERVIGSTRFWNLERWEWPQDHARHGSALDACEIGYTWFTGSAVRTGANTEAKALMLAQAFDVWNALRVCLHTDARNLRSRAAIERIGGKLEGILRAHRMASDFTPRDSVCYSIIAEEWPAVKERLSRLLNRG
jgi:RimJ/RimL family protein N-acetyltransferase